MSQDLERSLESIAEVLRRHGERLDALEGRGQDKGDDWGPPASMGYPSPTKPPTRAIMLPRGYGWGYDTVRAYSPSYYCTVLDMPCFGWEDQPLTLATHVDAFADANYYRHVIPYRAMWQTVGVGWDVWQSSVGDFEDYEECRAWSLQELRDGYCDLLDGSPWGGVPLFPICSLIVRNNGTTGAAGEFEPITLYDREQSSFLVRDLRPWFGGLW